MIFDLHVHEMANSADSKLNIYDGIKHAKALGLDGICITDHDSIGLRKNAERLSKESGIQIIVGVEIYSLDGDILCFGLDELPRKRLSAQDTIDFVNRRGGACIAAHPYRQNDRGLGHKMAELKGLTAIEAFNGRTTDYYNFKSLDVADTLNIPICGGSDAHTEMEIGNYVTEFEMNIKNEDDFIKALKSGRFSVKSLKGRETVDEKVA